MSEIIVENLFVNFRIYHDCSPSLKSTVSNLLSRKLPGYTNFSAVNGVSLHIKAGDRIGILGHNGAGKSTLLKALCRIYEPSSGKITVRGRIAPLLEVGAGFHPEFTGRENIYLNGAILGYTRKQIREVEQEVIAFAELEEFIDTPVKYYSTGMYSRLAFSLATAMQPDILILDEVFAGGDASFVQRGTVRLNKMIDRAHIMILVSHNLSQLETSCNRVIWMDHGKVKMDGNPAQVARAYKEDQKMKADAVKVT